MRLRTVGKIWWISAQGFAREFGPLAEITPCFSWIDDFFDFKKLRRSIRRTQSIESVFDFRQMRIGVIGLGDLSFVGYFDTAFYGQ